MTLINRHDDYRMYLHTEFAQKMADELIETNGHLLEKIPVDMLTYGQYNSAGVNVNEPEPVPNFYIKERDVHFYDSDYFIDEDEQEVIDNYNTQFGITMKERLPEPKNCLEIIKIAQTNWRLAICAVAELMNQLYNQTTVNVLVLADDYNWLFRPTLHKSFRYSSILKLNDGIPPNHMSLLRLFLKFDGHKIRRGLKVVGADGK